MLEKPTLIVGIGASAGGVNAVRRFLGKLDGAEPVAYVFLQHLDESGRQLAHDVLSHHASLPVVEIEDRASARPGVFYHAPPHSLVTIEDGTFRLELSDRRDARFTVIDTFFRSLSEDQGEHAAGVVLSGDGADGSQGLKAISDAGGMTLAQTPESADHPSMPTQAVSTGAVDHILLPEDMPVELLTYARHLGRLFAEGGPPSVYREITAALTEICEILLKATRHDFKHYKTSTLVRRIQRRMQVHQIFEAGEYLQKLRAEPKEVDGLFKELLINVTSFFRDPEAFAALKEIVLSRAFQDRKPEHKYRVWVAGCSTGEEVYTLAILIRELLDTAGRPPEVQIIATDIDEIALEQARKGAYPVTIAEHVSAERLGRFFIKKGGRYHVSKELRELVLFSSHNLINDPPFSQLDLISCRNVLIYLGAHLQKKLIPVFHYALKPSGALFLGTSETLAGHKELFRTLSARHRIAQRKATAIRLPGFSAALPHASTIPATELTQNHEADLHLVAQRILLDEFAPRYAVVNEDGTILSVSANVGRYLDPSEGTFQNNILKLVKPSLRAGLRAAFSEAKKTRRKVTHEDSTVRVDGDLQRAGITVQPMPQLGDESGLYMVVFHYLGVLHPAGPRKDVQDASHSDTAAVEQLERELTVLREDLERSVQDLEASNEELKSSNEELLSMNEELQSANEELEASKEEVQEGNDALQRSNTDLENLLASTEIATLFLDGKLQITSYTPALETIYNVTRSDVGRPLAHFTHRAKAMPAYPEPAEVARNREMLEEDVELTDGRCLLRRVSPYRTSEGKLSGMVVNFIDVTHLRRVEASRRESEHRFQIMADTAPVLVWIAGDHGLASWFNRGWLEFTGRSMDREIGKGWLDGVHPEDLDRCLKTYYDGFAAHREFYLEYRLRHRCGAYRWISDKGVPRYTASGAFDGFIGACMDIDAQKVAIEALRQNEMRLEKMFATSPAFMTMLSGPDLVFENANQAYLDLIGRRDIVGRPFKEVLPEVEAQGFIDILRRVVRTGESYVGREIPIMLLRNGATVPEQRYVDFVYQSDGSGETGRVFTHGTDVTEKVHARRLIESAKDAVEHERANFQSLFHQTPEMVCVLAGPDHRFEFVNDAHVRVLGFDATGETVRQAQPESVEVHGILDDVYRTGVTARLNEIAVTVGGRLRYFNLTYSARRDAEGRIDGVMILGTEITDQFLTREAIKSQREALELTLRGSSTESVLAVLTAMIEHHTAGQGLASSLLVSPDGKTLRHGAAPSLPDAYNRAIDGVAIGPAVGSCGTAAYRGKTVIVADIASDPLWKDFRELAAEHGLVACWSTPIMASDGKVLGTFALYYRDRRGPTPEEEQLVDLITRTAALVIERRAAMLGLQTARDEADRARETAEAASQAKTRFLANMSHEIRTPLGAIVGFAGLLSTVASGNEEAVSFVERITRNANQLSRLIDELLDLSKIEANKLEVERVPVDLQSAIEDAFAAFSTQAKKKGLEFVERRLTEIPKLVETDPTRLRQILFNLVGNAVKFTEHGRIMVELRVVRTGAVRVLEVKVTDTGIGLTAAQQARIFEPFTQADSSITRKYGGTGLGLALSRELARLLGGDIRLERSAPDVGTVFVLTIDLGSEAVACAVAPKPDVEENPTLKGKRILIVDDAPDNRALVARFLRPTEADAETAADGLEAVEKIRETRFDLVLMDLQMPRLDGYGAVVKLRAEGYGMPIVALTAHALKEERLRCLAAGFDEYVTKPINPKALIRIVTGLILSQQAP